MDNSPLQELRHIEYLYLSWLKEHHGTISKALWSRWANEPQFFCELLEMFYKKRNMKMDTKTTQVSEEELNRLADIFFLYKAVPGVAGDGTFCVDKFEAWMEWVTDGSKKNNRYEVAVHTIGNGLSYTDKKEDDLPKETVILDYLNKGPNSELRSGYCVGAFNQRGLASGGERTKLPVKIYSDAANSADEMM